MNMLDRILARIRRDLWLFWRDFVWVFGIVWRWIRDRFTDDVVIIDTAGEPTRESAERAMQAAIESNATLVRAMMRDATAIWIWAGETMTERRRATLPDNLSRALPLHPWMLGLTVREIPALKAAGAFAIMHHIFGDPENRIAGVRAVQELEESTLVFPKPPPPSVNDMIDRLSGGPSRVRKIR